MKIDEFDWLMQQGQYDIFSKPVSLSDIYSRFKSLDDDLRCLFDCITIITVVSISSVYMLTFSFYI